MHPVVWSMIRILCSFKLEAELDFLKGSNWFFVTIMSFPKLSQLKDYEFANLYSSRIPRWIFQKRFWDALIWDNALKRMHNMMRLRPYLLFQDQCAFLIRKQIWSIKLFKKKCPNPWAWSNFLLSLDMKNLNLKFVFFTAIFIWVTEIPIVNIPGPGSFIFF